MSAPVSVVMRRAAKLAASRSGGEFVSREARCGTGRLSPNPRPLSLSNLFARTCTYCGRTPRVDGFACHAHSDLPAIDPFFSPDVPQKAEPAEDFRPEALLDRLQPIGA